MLSTSIVGAKAAVTTTAATFASRLARFRSRKRAIFASMRLNAWASRMPLISSWISAVTSPVVSRVMRKARRASREKTEVARKMSGITVKLTSASGTFNSSIARTIPINPNSEPSNWVRPCDRS